MRSFTFCCFAAWVGMAGAQPAPPPAAEPAPAPGPEPAATQRVEIRAGRPDETQQRRQSTASKIVIGRDEIDRQGDGSVTELLRRLPGITVPGPAGRGGAPRMRGLGSGYTQILIDGQRIPPGFSLDSLVPEQIERIEILRAPTAETGARAIAGTINIVMREAFRRRLNDVRLGVGVENGLLRPSASWTRNDVLGERWTYNVSGSVYRQDFEDEYRSETPARGVTDHGLRREQREGVHLNGRLQWRGEGGETFTLSPFLLASQGRHTLRTTLTGDPAYDRSVTEGEGSFDNLRLNAVWAHRLAGGTRLEWRGTVGEARWRGESLRRETLGAGAPRLRSEVSRTVDRTAIAGLKATHLLEAGHSLVAGMEAETHRRDQLRISEVDETLLLSEFDANLQASSARYALYAQDEWDLSPHWAAHAGLRWEGITTRGDGSANRSSVATPLMHLVYKPDPKGRDQVRLSLTRSYRSPPLSDLIGRPTLSLRPNSQVTPDRAGNPDLKPELATGIDLAVERYLADGGVLSANLFHRRIRDMMRTTTTLETVSWSPDPRWVARPRNIGDAVTQGVELEAKFRLDQAIAGAPAVDVRANVSVFRSRVKSVPGPDNRIDRQPDGTLNLGADHKLRGWPLTVGGNYNLTPAYFTQLGDLQSAEQGRKRVIDLYALWTLRPGVQLRLTGSNLAPEASYRTSTVAGQTERLWSRTYVQWGARLELKL